VLAVGIEGDDALGCLRQRIADPVCSAAPWPRLKGCDDGGAGRTRAVGASLEPSSTATTV
jgi:hypothetical protein